MIDFQTIASDILKLAKQKGATQAEVSLSDTDGFTVNVRLGEVETIEYHRDKHLDIAVYFDKQVGSSSTTDIKPESIESAVTAACHIAKATGSDPCHGLADKDLMAKNYPDLDLCHPWNIDVNQAVELAKQCEAAGRDVSKKITNSEGASVSKHEGYYLYANSNDFIGHYASTRHGIHCVLLAENNGNKERDYEFSTSRDPHELWSPKVIGQKAAEKVIARLDARKLSTRKVPVLFTPRVAMSIWGHFISAINGNNLYRQASFLVNHLDKKVFPEFIHIDENPHILKALGSAPFDAEGVATHPKTFIEKGVLKNYVLNSYAARKLGMQSTGNAGGIHNLQIKPTVNNNLIQKMGMGLLVTEVMGQGVNVVTGDYSRGATGFWVENGEIQYPVHEITIAGNLKDMFLNIAAVGNDVDRRGNIWTGSLLIDHMTIAGE